ncbi:MAG TPA: hypothetical protein VFN92_04230 [Solirubrobacterales bacterium]|nr:hypothetical protein [Solirubrobacterales bacterium]
MDALDRALLRAREIYFDELDVELGKLLPALVEASYVREEPWGDSRDWFLWSFMEAGRKRADEIEGDPERS